MKLSEYLRQYRELELGEAVHLAKVAQDMASAIMQENAESQGRRYTTADSMWKELLRRAEEYDKKGTGTDDGPGTEPRNESQDKT
jgi:hypothetical protein